VTSRSHGPDGQVAAPDVEALAQAARLELSSVEIEELAPQLEQVLELFGELASIDVEEVEPLAQPLDQRCLDQRCPLRDDVVVLGSGGASAEAIVAAAEPSQLVEHHGAPLFRVPAVLRRG
jgi:aspartyl/glutamyl-tRNA(Asn/Gln) amidotransferase C subunit